MTLRYWPLVFVGNAVYTNSYLLPYVLSCARRLFDSQNNNRGGYNVGSLYYYSGSVLPIEWTNQHSCGDPNNKCDVILQYMCDENVRDGASTKWVLTGVGGMLTYYSWDITNGWHVLVEKCVCRFVYKDGPESPCMCLLFALTCRTIPDNPAQCENYDCNTDFEYVSAIKFVLWFRHLTSFFADLACTSLLTTTLNAVFDSATWVFSLLIKLVPFCIPLYSFSLLVEMCVASHNFLFINLFASAPYVHVESKRSKCPLHPAKQQRQPTWLRVSRGKRLLPILAPNSMEGMPFLALSNRIHLFLIMN